MILVILGFFTGLVVLVFGAEFLVRGSVKLADIYGVKSLFIGLTVIAFGTSAPELFIDVTAALHGKSQLAFGVLIGSNIANIGLILGIAALVRPIRVAMRTLQVEVPLLIAASSAVWLMASDGHVGRADGFFLLAGFAAFGLFLYRNVTREANEVKAEVRAVVCCGTNRMMSMIQLISGLIGLLAGAHLMVRSAVTMALYFKIDEFIIGMTVVAIGSSLPELAAAIVASYRRESDIVTGNILGSNMFNLLAIMALVALVQPVEVAVTAARFDIPLMVVLTLGLIPIMLRGRGVSRSEGALLVMVYLLFVALKFVYL